MTSVLSTAAAALVTSPAASLLVKVTLALTIGLLAIRLLRRARASVRHLILTATFGALIAIPLIGLVAPAVIVEIPAMPREPSSTATVTLPVSSRSHRAMADRASNGAGPRSPLSIGASSGQVTAALIGIWLAVAVSVALGVAVDLWRMRRIRRASLPALALRDRVRELAGQAGVRRDVHVLVSDQIQGPLVCGVMRPAIMLPPSAEHWSGDDLLRAVAHEMEHIRRADWPVQALSRVVCAAYWFHPLVWMAWRQLCLDAERACDDAVLRHAEPADYADQLVALARRQSTASAGAALGMAGPSDLSARVRALLNPRVNRGRLDRSTATCTVVLAAAVVLGIAPVRAVERQAVPAPAVARAPSPVDEALYQAASRGELDRIERLIAQGADVNVAINGDGSPLIGAAREGHRDVVQLLIDRGAKPDLAVRSDGNPLIMAARHGHLEIVGLLLDQGASIDTIVPGDENPLIGASAEGHLEIVRVLVDRGADVNVRAWAEGGPNRPNGEWRTPLNMAQRNGHRAVVQYLRSVGAQE